MRVLLDMHCDESVREVLRAFVEEARGVFGERLVAVLLYGSAAEGRMRKSSDVNVVVIATSFTPDDASALTQILSFGAAAVDLQVMFLLEEEVTTAAELFAVKFSDISRRRAVLYGRDPIESLSISREALKLRLRQVLLNHLLRLRNMLALRQESGEQLREILAHSIAPLRASASTILEMRGTSFGNSKEALERIAAELRPDEYKQALGTVSAAREGSHLSLNEAQAALSDVVELTSQLKRMVESIA